MQKEDARKQSRDVLHDRRKQVIHLLASGVGVMQTAELTGLSWSAVNAARHLYSQAGAGALRPHARGKKQGSGRSLSADQEHRLRRIICDQRPPQVKLDFALWSRLAVMALIERECAIKLSIRAVGNYLARWGFTPQRPLQKASEPRPEDLQAWRKSQYPAIEAQAKFDGAEIHWGMESAWAETHGRRTADEATGKTSMTTGVDDSRVKRSMIATVTNQGKTRWMIVDQAFESDKWVKFLDALSADTEKKVFLILDDPRVRRSKSVTAWAAEHAGRIELFCLPSRSTESKREAGPSVDTERAKTTPMPTRSRPKLRDAPPNLIATRSKSR